MVNKKYKFILLLFTLIFITTNLSNAYEEISQTDGTASAWFGQSEGYVNVGQGQSFRVNQEGWISEIQIYLEPSTGMPDPSDQIICDLRTLSDGKILQSQSIPGFTDGGWKSFSFDKKVTPGNYIFTCYFHRSYTLRDENYVIHGNSNDNSYLDGTRYDSTGGRPQDWSTWKVIGWDLKFKVLILTEIERNSPKTPDIPQGPASGNTDTSYTYSTSATDPNNDQITYIFDWGDGKQSPTYQVNSGSEASTSHIWTNPGIYTIKAKARDRGGFESVWSNELTVSIITPTPTPTSPPPTPTIIIPTPTSMPVITPQPTNLVSIIAVILIITGLVLTTLTTLKKDISLEVGVSERSLKYVGGAGILLIVIGAYILLKSYGLI